MNAVLLAAATHTDQAVRSSVAHARLAAELCLARAGVAPEHVGLLINTGIYRDQNLIEPAMAALIQCDLGITPDYARDGGTVAALSFDLLNGACGVISAIQVAQAFLAEDQVQHVLITASDAHPSLAAHRPSSFPYDATGAAMLLTRGSDPRSGFGQVAATSILKGGETISGYSDLTIPQGQARHETIVQTDPDATELLAHHASRLAEEYAAQHGLDLNRTRLIVSRTTPGLGAAVAERLGVPRRNLVDRDPSAPAPHTASLIADYLAAQDSDHLGPASPVMFLAAGAGPASACVVYHPIPEGPR
ncbi:hypothetical protein [Streptomyces sp. NPDC006879]|uniref:hypothetical protein n=1 Tax=Streptomyces sp. NPDC006879 TaxID=3364767 RepID=UPI0036909127